MEHSNGTGNEISTIPGHLILNKYDKDRLTDDLANKIKIGKKKDLPIMKVPVKYIKEILGIEVQPNEPEDNLVFFLASYREQVDVDRYNTKVDVVYELKHLKHRPTVLIALEKAEGLIEAFFDVITIKPPPEEEPSEPLP